MKLFKASAIVLLTCWAVKVQALPFNDDMVDVQPRAGSIMKPKPLGSIPRGSLSYTLQSREEALALNNPVAADERSIANGRRLFNMHCYTCHGDISKPTVVPGPSGAKFEFKKPPDISSGDFKTRTDGGIFATMYFGQGLMPRLGWKLSPQEKWDIINYLRKVQSTK
ncbi:MAG: c-type cytochrome [Oligoflexia bacterium]|nr:c-type cytochrome [Oligoflexia bacterium]